MNFSDLRSFFLGCLALLAVAAVSGCGGEDSLRLTLPDGQVVEYGGSIRLEARIKEQGNPPQDGEDVSFNTTVGSFEPFGQGVTDAVKSTTAVTAGGTATATLHSFPGEGGPGKVIASYVTINGITVKDEADIEVAGGGKPSGAMLSSVCDPQNVAAFADQQERQAMQVRCVVRAKDIRGNPVPKAQIRAIVESGCGIIPVIEDGTSDFVFSLSPTCDPLDVGPLEGEPRHLEGSTRNPRDGLLTIMFYTDGEEGYVDSNGNGQYDPGEPFSGQDQTEPFVDTDDNDQFDRGEPYMDVNKNGQWDYGNGKWDGATMIWTTTRIMFTGRPHESSVTTRFEPTGITIMNAGSQRLTLYLVDINHNPLATHSSDDDITFSVEGAQISGLEIVALTKTMGVEFIDGKINVSSFSLDRTYQVTLQDLDPDPQSPTTPVTLRTSIEWMPAPDFGNYSATQQTANLGNVTGNSQ